MLLRILVLAAVASLCAAEEPAPSPSPDQSPIKEIGNGVFQIGGVKFDKNAKTATFAGSVNLTKSTIEYLLVGTSGKTHESLFATAIQPYDLHLAMLLLGATGTPDESPKTTPPTAIDAAYLKKAPVMKGDPVTISVRWNLDGKETVIPAEDLVTNDAKKKPMSRGPWIYNGSMVVEGKFLAQDEQSFIAIVTDPAALLNNPRPGRDDDEAWSTNTSKLPPVNTPVEITIKLESQSKQPK